MKFDLDKILSMLKGKKRKSSVEDFEGKEELFDDVDSLNEEEFDEEIFEDEVESENSDVKKESKPKKEKPKKEKKKISIDFKNRKVQLLIVAIVVLAIGAVSAPYIMSYIGEKQADNIGDVSSITQSVQMPMPKPKPRPVTYPHKNNMNNRPTPSHMNQMNRNRNVENRQNHIKITPHKAQERVAGVNNNFVKHTNNKVVSPLRVENKPALSNNTNNKIAQIEQAIKGTNEKIKEIQNHLVNARLKGVNDPIGMVDETIMQNRNFDLYLQSQIQLMRKLVSYYKQRAELQKTLQLYKMAFYGDNGNSNYGNNIKNEQRKREEEIQKALQKVVAPLQQQIFTLKQELIKARQRQKNNENRINTEQRLDFNQMAKIKLNDLNIFMKNGKYIAVVHTEFGDKIFKEGDYFNGYKIYKILPNIIIFERDGQKFYYTYNQTLNQKYEVAKIALPAKITTSEVRTRNGKREGVKEYKPVSRQKLLQELLQKRLQQIK